MALAISKKSIWVKILVMLCALALLAVFALPPRAHAVVALTGAAAFTAALLLWLGYSASSGVALHDVAQHIADGFSQSVKDLLDQGTQIVNGKLTIDPSTVQDSRFYSIVDQVQSEVSDLEVTIPVGGYDVPAYSDLGLSSFSCTIPTDMRIGDMGSNSYPYSISSGSDIFGVFLNYNGSSTSATRSRIALFACSATNGAIRFSLTNQNYLLTSSYSFSGKIVYYCTISTSVAVGSGVCSPWTSNSSSDAAKVAWAMVYGADVPAGGDYTMIDVGSITAQAIVDAMVNTANGNTPITLPLNAVPDLQATINGTDVPLTGTQEDAVIPSSFAPSLDTPLDIHNSNIFSRIWEWLQNFWTDLTSTITGAISGIATGVNSIVQAIEGIFEAIANPFAEFFTELLPSFWTTLVGTINGSILNFASIWHYVVSWVVSLGSGFTLIRSVWSGLPYAMVVPIYASLVVVLVFFVFKRIFF